MFTRKEKNMLFDPYFEVIRETEQFIEVRSVNTGHCWSIFQEFLLRDDPFNLTEKFFFAPVPVRR